MTAPAPAPTMRKGWCPGALRPMIARDGLLVRLKLTGGIVPAKLARALADIADRYGNGLFDLSARANLQMRGVSEASYPRALEALDNLDVLDADPAAEAIRNVLASPLAGLHDGVDVRPLTAALEARLAGDATLAALPGKFGFLMDDGSSPDLGEIGADVRFDWREAAGGFAVGLGGTRTGALPVGMCAAGSLVARAVEIAHGFLALRSHHPNARRMGMLRTLAGDGALAEACGGTEVVTATPTADSCSAPVGARSLSGVAFLGLAAPFGRLDADMLRVAADLACGELRLTPWRTILLPFGAQDATSRERAGRSGWIVDPTDPRLRVATCSGKAGCANATTPTHHDATALADLAGALGSERVALHVSGCSKGCAKAGPSVVTLVGHEGRYDLVRSGRASDIPTRRGLALAECRAELTALAAARA